MIGARAVSVLVCLALLPGLALDPTLGRLKGAVEGKGFDQRLDVPEGQAITRLREIQQELISAWLQQDRPAIERLLAPDWSVTGPTGVTSTRAQVLGDAFERRVHRLLSGTVTDVSVRLVGRDAAVVTGHTQATGTYSGERYAADIRFTDVFERHDGDWRAVRSHASSIVKR
jgi:ketosteroid isomerase-like protein